MHERWARLRFSVIGQLLAAPPAKGALRAALQQLAAREWRHPTTGAPIRFGVSTLERWLYRARNEQHDPVSLLRRKRRQDAGEQASMTTPLRQALLAQYDAHKSWSAQLHHDNLVALAETRPELRPVPSYATVRRFLAAHGLTRRRPMTARQTSGALAAAARLEVREVRSYESEYVNATWHWDCHYGSRKVLTDTRSAVSWLPSGLGRQGFGRVRRSAARAAGTQLDHRARWRRQRLPSGDSSDVRSCLGVVGDPRKSPAQLDSSRQLALLAEDGADCIGIGLGDEEHPKSMVTCRTAGKGVP